jgi:hypothetical protein
VLCCAVLWFFDIEVIYDMMGGFFCRFLFSVQLCRHCQDGWGKKIDKEFVFFCIFLYFFVFFCNFNCGCGCVSWILIFALLLKNERLLHACKQMLQNVVCISKKLIKMKSGILDILACMLL